MQRRDLLRAGCGIAAAGLAGCSGLITTEAAGGPPVLDDRPNAVYYPTHVEGMRMAGRGESGDYGFALTYSYPHRFWNVNGREVSRTDIEDDDDVHLMAIVWDRETKRVLPEAGLSLEIERDGKLVSQEVIYPMLSQPMGFHYGANFGLGGGGAEQSSSGDAAQPQDGTYAVTASVGGISTRRTGGYTDRIGDGASATIEFEYAQAERDDIEYERTPDRAGEQAAVEPMNMSVPTGVAPAVEELSGVLGEVSSGDARLVVGALAAPPAGIEANRDARYLYVSARTPYNGMVLPAMTVEAATGGFDGKLTRTLDPELGYHYGATVAELGERVAVEPTLPPQTARHEGYETAFLEFERGEVSV